MTEPAFLPFLLELGQSLANTSITILRGMSKLDVVAGLDHMAEAAAARFLVEHFPDDTLLAEESTSSVRYAERIWSLDPLDGRVARASKAPFFAISLLVKERGGVYRNLERKDPCSLQPDSVELRGGTDPCIAAAPRTLEVICPLLKGLAQ